MVPTVALALTLVAAAPAESRVFIASGAKTKAAAQQALEDLRVPEALVLRAGYPALVESSAIAGLKPGFWLVVLGVCDDTGRWSAHNNGLAALLQRALKGAYAKPVGRQPAGACPSWVEAPDEAPAAQGKQALAQARAAPDDAARAVAAAAVLRQGGALTGACLLLRRALALGKDDEATLGLLRTVEFILEDVPWRLPP